MKQKAMFAVSVIAVVAIVAAFQQHVYKVPAIGKYLPGGQ